MRYTVKQLADLAGITPRTLHYYDEIGLLHPSEVGDNGYRYYGEPAARRLQQILFYRALGLNLNEILAILDDPHFDAEQALRAHRAALQVQAVRVGQLIETVDKTLAHLHGERTMKAEELFGGFETEQEKERTQQAMDLYGHDNAYVQESARRWRSYSTADKARIKEEGEAIYRNLVLLIDQDPGSPNVQDEIASWHTHLRYYYEPTPQLLAGLGDTYIANSDFAATFAAMHPDLPRFLHDAIAIYVERLPS